VYVPTILRLPGFTKNKGGWVFHFCQPRRPNFYLFFSHNTWDVSGDITGEKKRKKSGAQFLCHVKKPMYGSFMKIVNSSSYSFLPQGPLFPSSTCPGAFTLQLTLNFGRAYIQPKSSIPIGGKVEISSNGFFTLWVNATLEKIFSICPQVTNKCWALWALYWPQGWKKDTIEFGRPICNPWGQCSNIY